MTQAALQAQPLPTSPYQLSLTDPSQNFRVCPGQHVANRSVFLNTALMMWAYRISEDPSKLIDTMAFSDTANMHAAQFEAVFEPRMPVDRLRMLLEGYGDEC